MKRNSYPVYALAKMIRLMLLPIAKLKYGKKHIWLICERGNDARDNGYHMFRYLRKEHPEINAYYVITGDSVYLDKVSGLGNVVHPHTLDYWLKYISAEKILTAFDPLTPTGNKRFAEYVAVKSRQKTIFLQHGIIANDMPYYYKEQSRFDMFICGAKPEYDFVSQNFHYTDGEVRYTGLARFDALHNISPIRQILIMPTWRRWLSELSGEEVKESEYVRRWNSLLNSPELAGITKRYDVKVVFYPHQMMQKFVGLFSSDNPMVEIADCKTRDVQTLLKESALLITDASSIHFDFAYMKKPLLYYQFDEDRFFKEHYEHGYFDFDKMGFGPKVNSEEELLADIEKYASDDFRQSPEYSKRIEGFFPLYDSHNCERIFKEITESFDK